MYILHSSYPFVIHLYSNQQETFIFGCWDRKKDVDWGLVKPVIHIYFDWICDFSVMKYHREEPWSSTISFRVIKVSKEEKKNIKWSILWVGLFFCGCEVWSQKEHLMSKYVGLSPHREPIDCIDFIHGDMPLVRCIKEWEKAFIGFNYLRRVCHFLLGRTLLVTIFNVYSCFWWAIAVIRRIRNDNKNIWSTKYI